MSSEVDTDTHKTQLQQYKPAHMGGGYLLLELPAVAIAAALAHLSEWDRKNLRLLSKAAQSLVDCHVQRLELRLASGAQQPSSLPERFPHVSHLTLTAPCDGGQVQPCSFSSWGPWAHVTKLVLPTLPISCASLVALCPNVHACQLDNTGANSAYHDNLNTVCSSLTALADLELSEPLSDDALHIVASCSTLTSLHAYSGACSASGWALLSGMVQLKDLDLVVWSAAPQTGALSGLQRLTCLTQLSIGAPRTPPMRSISGLHLCDLQLPPSLVTLSLERFPLPVTPAPANLTTVTLDSTVILDHVGLAAFATGRLRSLTVRLLRLTRACHEAPLTAATELCVTARIIGEADVRMALVFPALRQLVLKCECQLDGGAQVLAGMAALERLEASWADQLAVRDYGVGSRHGLNMDAAGMKVLAALPALVDLQLNATPAHVRGWGDLLRVQRMKWVFLGDSSIDFLHDLHTAMGSASVGPDLKHVTAVFWRTYFDDIVDVELVDYLEQHIAFTRVAGATIVLLAMRAHGLHSLRWEVDCSECADVSDPYLLALASNTSIQRIEVVNDIATTSAAAVKHVMQLHAGRGLQVVLESGDPDVFTDMCAMPY